MFLIFDLTYFWVALVLKHIWTRNTFCWTWYLPHSQVHNDPIVPIIMVRCIAHARSGHISTSAPKSDVTVVFLDPDFLSDAKISAIRVYLMLIWDYLISAWIFMTSWLKISISWQNGWCDIDPNELFYFWDSYVCAIFGDWSRNTSVRVSIDAYIHWQTEWQTDRRKPIL